MATMTMERPDVPVAYDNRGSIIYSGWRVQDYGDNEAQTRVTVEKFRIERSLDWRLDLRNHSPTGLEWGYAGSGPSQLALAILADYLEDDQRALRLYQPFKFDKIQNLPHSRWMITDQEIDLWLREKEGSHGVFIE